MRIVINGTSTETRCATLEKLVKQLDYATDKVATAVDGAFVSRERRAAVELTEGMEVEIVAPMQGG